MTFYECLLIKMLFLALKSNSLEFKNIYLMRDASFLVASYLGEIKLMLESNLKEKSNQSDRNRFALIGNFVLNVYLPS